MTKNKDGFEKNNDEFDKWDLILASSFVIALAIGLLIAVIVILKMAY